MTTSQASRIFGIPYNSLLMYVRGKYGKSLKLEQLRKDCISGPPIELLQMGQKQGNSGSGNNTNSSSNNNNNSGSGKEQGNHHPTSKELKDFEMSMSGGGVADVHGELMSGSNPNPMFNPFPANFYPDFPGFPLSMLNLLPPDRHAAASMGGMDDDEDCKSEDRSKQSEDDYQSSQPLEHPSSQQQLHQHHHHRPEMLLQHQE